MQIVAPIPKPTETDRKTRRKNKEKMFVTGHMSSVACHASHVTKADSHSHRPSPQLCRGGWFAKTKQLQKFQNPKIIEAQVGFVQWYKHRRLTDIATREKNPSRIMFKIFLQKWMFKTKTICHSYIKNTCKYICFYITLTFVPLFKRLLSNFMFK